MTDYLVYYYCGNAMSLNYLMENSVWSKGGLEYVKPVLEEFDFMGELENI